MTGLEEFGGAAATLVTFDNGTTISENLSAIANTGKFPATLYCTPLGYGCQ
jgi:hypothetical protein